MKHLGLGVGYNYAQINLNYSGRDNFVNRIRYDLGAGTKVSDAWRVELHYVLQDGREIEDLFEDLFDSGASCVCGCFTPLTEINIQLPRREGTKN
ncbi:MAG: hypothetical protein AB1Z31_21905, partial [Desulfobacterales bacterium]